MGEERNLAGSPLSHSLVRRSSKEILAQQRSRKQDGRVFLSRECYLYLERDSVLLTWVSVCFKVTLLPRGAEKGSQKC